MFILCSLLCRFDVFFVCGIGSFLVPRSDFSPSPLYELSPYRRGGCSSIARQSKEQRKNSKRKPGFALFFLLLYGVTTEYQPFKFFNRN